jgi:long-subunit fatty acid transport protein
MLLPPPSAGFVVFVPNDLVVFSTLRIGLVFRARSEKKAKGHYNVHISIAVHINWVSMSGAI